MTPLEQLDQAEAALADAAGLLARYEQTRDEMASRIDEITARLEAAKSELAELSVDVAAGFRPPETLDAPRETTAALERELADSLRARDALVARLAKAQKDGRAAWDAFRRACDVVAKPVYEARQRERLDAWRAFCRAQRAWIDVAEMGQNMCPWDGACFVQPVTLDEIAAEEGVRADNLRPTALQRWNEPRDWAYRATPTMSTDELRRLHAEHTQDSSGA